MAIDDMLSGAGRRRDGGPRRSGSRALVFWTVALIAGGSAAMLLRWYVERSAQPSAIPLSRIVVAAKDLSIATTLEPEHLKFAEWPQSAQPPGSFLDPKELIGRVVTNRIFQGEPLLAAKLASKDAGRGLAALIPAGMRAQAVRVDEVVGVAGFIHPDDHVDVIATVSSRGSAVSETVSKVILQNVKVLAVGKDLEVADNSRSKSVAVTVATLLVTPAESEKLALTARDFNLMLTLRSWTDENSVDTPGASATSLVTGVDLMRNRGGAPVPAVVVAKRGKKGRKDEETPPAAGAPVSTAPQKEVVEILRGDRFEERKFDSKDKP